MGRRTHGPHLLAAIDANNHAKVHEILSVQVRNKSKIHETCISDVKRLASDNVDCPLMLAATIPDPSIIRYLITKQSVDVNFMHRNGTGLRIKQRTPLITAVKKGLYLTVEVLLELNANTNLQDHKGRTALHHAIFQANYRMAKMLLTKGAQPNLSDKEENSALHVGTKFGHLELVKLLMQYGGDLYKRGQYGAIPIHIAAREGHVSLIEWFSTHGSNINLKVPCFTEMREKSPLNVACEEGHIEAVLLLVQKCKADVNLADSEGETPLHCTVLHEYDPFGMKSKDDFADTALVLLKFGADCNMRNERGETALHHAARNEFQKVAELLIRAGSDPCCEDHDRNKAIDLVSDDDVVTKNLLKRAVNDHDKLMSELLEIKARGFSTSTHSLNQLMLNNSMSSANGPMSQSLMHIPSLNNGLINRTSSTPGLFMPDGTIVYSEDGYLQPFSSRPRLGSIASQRSFGAHSFAGMPLARQDSIGSFHSAMTAPPNAYCSIDSDGVVSESAAVGIVAPRLIRRKRGDKKTGYKATRESSDSSQYEDMPMKPKHSTPRRSVSSDLIHIDNQRKAKKPKAPFVIQPIGKQAGRKQAGQTAKLRNSQTSLNSQASTISASSSIKSESSSVWDVTPFTSHSTLRAGNDDTSECNTSSRSTLDGSLHTPTDDPYSAQGEDVTDGDVYENIPCDDIEEQPIYNNIPDDRSSIKENPTPPEPPPRTRRPLPPLPPSRPEESKPLPVLPKSPSRSSNSKYDSQSGITPTGKQSNRSSQEITIKISPHQSITIKTSPNGQPQAMQVNSLLPEDQAKRPSSVAKMNSTIDSDDTFFDDDSFETTSDFLEPDARRQKINPSPKPPNDKGKKKPTPEQLEKVLDDPKIYDWLADQAVLLKDRKPDGSGPIAQSTPPLSRRELENKLRQAFGKPPLSDPECSDNETEIERVTPVPKPQIPTSINEGQHQVLSHLKSNTSLKGAEKDLVEYTEMNDLNSPSRSITKSDIPKLDQSPIKAKAQQQKPPQVPPSPRNNNHKWEKIQLAANSNNSSISSLYWDHTEDTSPAKNRPQQKQKPPRQNDMVYMEMNGKGNNRTKPVPPAKPELNQEQFNQQVQNKLQQHQQEDEKAVKPSVESDDFDDDSFDSFNSESDDEAIPNSCHQVARYFRLPPQNGGICNLVLATPAGDIVPPDARHSSTNAHSIMLPGASEMAERMGVKPPGSPTKAKKVPPAVRGDIVVVRDGALVNGMSINQPSPLTRKRTNSIQEERNAQLVTSIKHSPIINNNHRTNSTSDKQQTTESTRRGSVNSIGSTSYLESVRNGQPIFTENKSDSDSPASQQRKVTIGSEEIKLISDIEKVPKDYDHRNITFDTKGKMRITLIGGNSDGVFIHRIDPGSDAEQQGLMEGDQILEINGLNNLGRTKEEVTLQLMSLQERVNVVVRHKKDRYNSIRLNGGMGDSFFVKAHFSHDSKVKGEMKINVGDIFSVRDTLPNGRIGSWQALKVNAKPNEVQHGLIPNESRAEQVALAARKAVDRGRGFEKENRGSFIRRSLRRSKSAERLNKENEAFTKSQVPQLEDVRTYEWVEQRGPGFLRPVIILGLFCDTVRDRLLQDLPGLFEKPPPEVEIPTRAEAGDSNKLVPVDVQLLEKIIRMNKHPLIIMSPRAIQYLVTTKLYPIVIYLTPGRKDVVKKLRSSLAPGFSKRSAFMFEESQLFYRTYADLFTVTVTYTVDDSWYALLKDTIKRIQNQPLWQPTTRGAPNKQESIHSDKQTPNMSPENKFPRLTSSARIPDPIRNALQRHATGGSSSTLDTDDPMRPPQMSLTYDGYFLSESQERPGSARPLQNGTAKSLDNIDVDIRPRSILKTRKPSAQSMPQDSYLDVQENRVSPTKTNQQLGLVVATPQKEENNNRRVINSNNDHYRSQQQMTPHKMSPQQINTQKMHLQQMSPQQVTRHQMSQQEMVQQQQMMEQQQMMQQQQMLQQQQNQGPQPQSAMAQQMLIQQMFQQQFMNQQEQQQNQLQQHYQQQHIQNSQAKQPLTRNRGLTHESIETDL